jgi:hypothetical protein
MSNRFVLKIFWRLKIEHGLIGLSNITQILGEENNGMRNRSVVDFKEGRAQLQD